MNGDGIHFYSCEIYFDVVFGVFVFRDVSKLAQNVKVGGLVVDQSGKPLPRKNVALNVDGKTFVTKTGSTGAFAFRLPGLPAPRPDDNAGPMTFHVTGRGTAFVQLKTLPH